MSRHSCKLQKLELSCETGYRWGARIMESRPGYASRCPSQSIVCVQCRGINCENLLFVQSDHGLQQFYGPSGQRYVASIAILCLGQMGNTAQQVHARPGQTDNFRSTHGGFERKQ